VTGSDAARVVVCAGGLGTRTDLDGRPRLLVPDQQPAEVKVGADGFIQCQRAALSCTSVARLPAPG
jgi:hypothetical protein